MSETDIASDRLLLISVIKQAIVDSLLHVKPKPPNVKYRRYGSKKTRTLLRKNLIFISMNYRFFDPKNILIPLLTYKMVEKVLFLNSKEPKKNNDKAYIARLFLSDKNKVFRRYNELLGIDPTYSSEKINRVIGLFDAGNKNILREIKHSIDFIERPSIL